MFSMKFENIHIRAYICKNKRGKEERSLMKYLTKINKFNCCSYRSFSSFPSFFSSGW